MKKILCAFIFFTCFISLFGQSNDSIRQEILDQTPSEIDVLSRGRAYLLSNLEKGNLFKVMEIKNALLKEVNNNVHDVFYPGEYSLILFWTEEYHELLDYIRTNEYVDFRADQLLEMMAARDQLPKHLSVKSAESYDLIVNFIHEATLTDVEKDYLELHLYWLLFGPNYITEKEALDSLNTKADAFLKKHPNSEFDEFVRNNIRYKLVLNNWGIGYEMAMGYMGMRGNLGYQFNDGFLLRFSLDGTYKKTLLSLNVNMGATSTKVDFPYNSTIWEKGAHATMFDFDLALGYRVLETNQFTLSPFVGYGALIFSPGEKEIQENGDLEGLNFSSQNVLAGISCQYFYNKEYSPFSKGGGYLSVRYTFSKPQYNGKHNINSGSMHWITVGWGIYGRPFKRLINN